MKCLCQTKGNKDTGWIKFFTGTLFTIIQLLKELKPLPTHWNQD